MISKLTDIHSEAKIGENVTIGSFTTIQENVTIGDNTWIGPNVTIMSGSRIGNNCRIFPGAVIGAVPQDLKFEGEDSLVEVGDHTTIRECVTLNRGTKASGVTKIGKNVLLMAYVHIAHDCIISDHCIIANAVQVAGHVQIDEYAIIGGTCAIHQFSKVGAHAMVSGGSLIRKDVPPYVKAGREPLVYVGVNSLGLRRRGFSNDLIIKIQDMYRIVFQKGFNTKDAVKAIQEEIYPCEERDVVTQFIGESERGIIRGGTKFTGASIDINED